MIESQRVQVTDALVDTGATTLALPTRLIEQLGLMRLAEKRSRSSRGTGLVAIYEPVRVTIQGRDATVDVMEAPDDVPC